MFVLKRISDNDTFIEHENRPETSTKGMLNNVNVKAERVALDTFTIFPINRFVLQTQSGLLKELINRTFGTKLSECHRLHSRIQSFFFERKLFLTVFLLQRDPGYAVWNELVVVVCVWGDISRITTIISKKLASSLPSSSPSFTLSTVAVKVKRKLFTLRQLFQTSYKGRYRWLSQIYVGATMLWMIVGVLKFLFETPKNVPLFRSLKKSSSHSCSENSMHSSSRVVRLHVVRKLYSWLVNIWQIQVDTSRSWQ